MTRTIRCTEAQRTLDLEVDPKCDFVARAEVYRHHGYFPASDLREVSERLAAASVTEPQRLLRRFVELAEG